MEMSVEMVMLKRLSDGLYHIKENPVETTKFFTMNYLRDDINKVMLVNLQQLILRNKMMLV